MALKSEISAGVSCFLVSWGEGAWCLEKNRPWAWPPFWGLGPGGFFVGPFYGLVSQTNFRW
jgi:hypothetical protein